MILQAVTTSDDMARARREEVAAQRSASPEARLAHEELARLYRERARDRHSFEAGLSSFAG